MALLLTEGFELNNGSTQLGRKYASASGSDVGAQAAPRVVGFGKGTRLLLETKPLVASPTPTLVHGWGHNSDRMTGGFVGPGYRIYWQRGGVNQVSLSLSMSTDGRQFSWILKRGDESGTTLATFGPFWAGKWYYFEMSVTCHTSTGAYEFKVDDVTYATDTGLNTAFSGSNDADNMRFEGSGTGTHQSTIDDLYIDDAAFHGPIIVASSLPTTNGAQVEYVPSSGGDHASLVNDSSDSTLVTTNASNQVEIFNMAAIDARLSTGVIKAVAYEVTGAMSSPGSRTIFPRYRNSGGTQADGPSSFLFDNTSTVNQYKHLTQQPVSASAWVFSDLSGQFGLRTA